MARRKYKRYKNKYKRNQRRISVKEFINIFQWFCISYAGLFFLTSVLDLLSKVSDSIFFKWCGIISVILSFPTSQSDILIMVFRLDWWLIILGVVFAIYKLYNILKDSL